MDRWEMANQIREATEEVGYNITIKNLKAELQDAELKIAELEKRLTDQREGEEQ